jgi:hypothetical protein
LIDNNNLFYFFTEKVNNNFFYYYLSKKLELSVYFDYYLLIKNHVIKFTTQNVNYFSAFNKNINIYKKYNQYFYYVNVKTLNLKVPVCHDYYFFDFFKLYNKSPYYTYPLDNISKTNNDFTNNDSFLKEKIIKYKYPIYGLYEYDQLEKKLAYYKKTAPLMYKLYMSMYNEIHFRENLLMERIHNSENYRFYLEHYAKYMVRAKDKLNTESRYNMSIRIYFRSFFASLYKHSKLFHLYSFSSYFKNFFDKNFIFNNNIVSVTYFDSSDVISSTYLDFFQKK